MSDIKSMSALEAIKTRFSVRKYTDEPISDEHMHILLDAGFSAPSACNIRPWHFVVITERQKLDAFAQKGRFQKMLYQVPAAIMVCGGRSLNHDLLINDCSAATQNILLAAHAIGLGACWCGIAQKTLIDFSRKQLDLPEKILPVALIALGHPAESREQKERFNEKRVHYNTYGEKEE